MKQVFSKTCIWHGRRRCFEDFDLVSSSSMWGMMDCDDMPDPQDPHSSSQFTTYSEMVCMPLFSTQPHVPHGCYLQWMCVCLCVSVWVSSLQREGWSGLKNILCDSTSRLSSLSSDISLSLLHCNSLTVHSLCFVQVPVLKGMMCQPMSFFRNIPEDAIEKFSIWTGQWKHKQNRLLWVELVCASLFYDFGKREE